MLQSGQILRKRFLKVSYFDTRFEAPAGGPNIARFLNFPCLSSLNCSQIWPIPLVDDYQTELHDKIEKEKRKKDNWLNFLFSKKNPNFNFDLF